MTKETVFKKGRAMFNLVGKAKRNDYTFDLDKTSDSGWHYSRANIGIDVGNANVVYGEMMGGYSTVRDNLLYVNAKDDFKNRFTIDFEDRHTEGILETINELNFIKIGIEKDASGKTVERKFLSEYDAIAYLEEKLEEGMVVNVKGDIEYSIYNEEIQTKKVIKSIFLSKAEEDKFKATFTQSILIDSDSVGKLNKELQSFPIDCHVVDYIGKIGSRVVKKTLPMYKQLELELNKEKSTVTKAIIDRFLTVKNGVTEVVMEGVLIEGQQTIQVSEDDIPDDIKELIDCGIYDKEEILNKMAVGGDRIQRMVLTKPYVRMVGDDDNKTPQTFVEIEKYTVEEVQDGVMELFNEEESEEDIENQVNEGVEDAEESEEGSSDDDWMNNLGIE